MKYSAAIAENKKKKKKKRRNKNRNAFNSCGSDDGSGDVGGLCSQWIRDAACLSAEVEYIVAVIER